MNPQKRAYSLDEFDQAFPEQTLQASQTNINQNTPNQYGAIFRATGQESGVEAGLKAAGNVLPSAYNLGKGVVGAITSPVQTAKGIGGIITDIGRKGTNLLTDLTGLGKKQETPSLNALGQAYFGEEGRYGSREQALKTAIEDPFGVGADILGVISGGAGAVGKTAALDKAISATGKLATKPVTSAFSGFGKAVTSTTKFGASQLTGLSPETISTITSDSKAFSAAQKAGTTRTDLAENVFDAVKKAQDDISDLGSGYQAIRESGASVSLPDNWVTGQLDKFGLKFKNGVVSADKTSATRNVTDINKIQEFVNNWGDAKTLTAEEYLNMRSDLAELAKYDMSGKSNVARKFGQDVREGFLNSGDVRGQIEGLKDLDKTYAADRTFLNQIEKDFIDKKTGNLKDGAASKVVNAINAANPERLARLEQLYPGFTQQAKVVKALEDVENAMGLKVGAYTRAAVGAGAALTGNAPVVIGAILSAPEIAVPLLKGYGYTAEQIRPILQIVKDISSDINNFRTPVAVEQYIKENYKDGVPVGLSIKKTVTPESVAKKIDKEDYRRLAAVIDDPAAAKQNTATKQMLDNMGLSNATNAELTSFAKEVIDEYDGVANRPLTSG